MRFLIPRRRPSCFRICLLHVLRSLLLARVGVGVGVGGGGGMRGGGGATVSCSSAGGSRCWEGAVSGGWYVGRAGGDGVFNLREMNDAVL